MNIENDYSFSACRSTVLTPINLCNSLIGMAKTLLTIIFSLLVGVFIGAAGTVFFYPFLFPPPEVNEQVHDIDSKKVFATGTFIHPNPSDKLHYGKGTVSIYELKGRYEVFLGKNFQVGPGPAFHVYLSELSNIKSKAAFQKGLETGKNYDIGILKSFKGSQVYPVPANVDMNRIKSVVVWCKSFHQLITSADLKRNR